VNRINDFYSIYGLTIGGGDTSQKKRDLEKKYNRDFHKNIVQLDNDIGKNLGNLNGEFLKNYKVVKTQMAINYNNFTVPLVEIGQL
jgi:hypothetical protein